MSRTDLVDPMGVLVYPCDENTFSEWSQWPPVAVLLYVLLYIYMLNYFSTRDIAMWCGGEAGLRWDSVGIIDIWRMSK
jgi:hypothetical protein